MGILDSTSPRRPLRQAPVPPSPPDPSDLNYLGSHQQYHAAMGQYAAQQESGSDLYLLLMELAPYTPHRVVGTDGRAYLALAQSAGEDAAISDAAPLAIVARPDKGSNAYQVQPGMFALDSGGDAEVYAGAFSLATGPVFYAGSVEQTLLVRYDLTPTVSEGDGGFVMTGATFASNVSLLTTSRLPTDYRAAQIDPGTGSVRRTLRGYRQIGTVRMEGGALRRIQTRYGNLEAAFCPLTGGASVRETTPIAASVVVNVSAT